MCTYPPTYRRASVTISIVICLVTAQTMQGVIANLARDGLIERREHPTHGRILETGLTANGHEVLCQAHSVVSAIEQTMIGSLAPPGLAALTEALAQCADNLS